MAMGCHDMKASSVGRALRQLSVSELSHFPLGLGFLGFRIRDFLIRRLSWHYRSQAHHFWDGLELNRAIKIIAKAILDIVLYVKYIKGSIVLRYSISK